MDAGHFSLNQCGQTLIECLSVLLVLLALMVFVQNQLIATGDHIQNEEFKFKPGSNYE